MPADKVKELQSDKYSPEDNLTHLSKKFHTSLVAAAIRTQSLRIFGNKLVDWAKQRQAEELRLKSDQKTPGGDFYNTAISRIDLYYANAVINAESSGDMAIAKAASMLGVILKTYHKTVDKILEMA